MVTTEKTNRAVERLAETTRDSYQTVVDHAVGLQERNVRFAQGVVDGTIKELRHQAESNRNVVGELFERAEDQRDAYQDPRRAVPRRLHGPRLRALQLLQGGPGGHEEGRPQVEA